MTQFFPLLLVLFFCLPALADEIVSLSEPYRSGKDLCTGSSSRIKDLRPNEMGFYIDVPVDYQNPARGKTPLYAWTLRPFEKSKPTFVEFVGGPGGSAHGNSDLESLALRWNVIHFDQRGTGCSRPDDKNLLLDHTFFSSENTTRDAEEIRKHLGIPVWSAYGHSYGTIPATMTGNLFPQTLKAVVVEGVILDGEDIWLAPHRLKVLQKRFDRLPKELRDFVLDLSRRPKIPSHWFSALGQSSMYLNFSEQVMLSELLRLMNLSKEELILSLRAKENPMAMFLWDNEFPGSVWTLAQIACQELNEEKFQVSFWAEFDEKNKLVPKKLAPLTPICEQLKIGKSEIHYYHASDYPTQTPVTYFVGAEDGATVAPFGIRHWKQVPQKFAQLLIAPKGGHAPMNSNSAEEARPLFDAALSGDPITCEQVKDYNEKNKLKFVFSWREQAGQKPKSCK